MPSSSPSPLFASNFGMLTLSFATFSSSSAASPFSIASPSFGFGTGTSFPQFGFGFSSSVSSPLHGTSPPTFSMTLKIFLPLPIFSSPDLHRMPVPPLTGEALCPEHSVTKPSSLHRALISPSASTVPSYGEPTAPTEERSPFLASLRGHRPSQIEIALSHLCSTTSPNVALALQPVLFIANQITTGNEHQPPPTSSLLHWQSLLFLVVQ
ncbi:hypothetical protein OPV22_021498 [Ensete ventricosum]|uniref:Uncharacterized protein n=1 Tax=Ensete ventricosum TaxID=4639 RepID=A0AAV8PAX6_ENSVE|nr:hypothetical protein OPV22_021498 [Ensete ventricosum]